jgi:hypothetical protein
MHKQNITRIVILLLMITLLVFPGGVRAQESPELSSVEVALWPEFDQPTMLVIYRISLPPQTALPVELSLPIPTSATVNAVATRQPDGSLLNLPYTDDESGGWTRLVFQATTPEIQVEYYDSELIKDGSGRHYEYGWAGENAVNSFVIEVQQPVDATEMRISPNLGGGTVGSDGLNYYSSEVGPLAQNQSFKITIDYQKSTDTLSAQSVSVAPSAPLDDTTSGLNLSSVLPYILGGLGVLLLGGGAYWYWRSGQEETSRPKRNRGSRKRSSPAIIEETSGAGEHVYCHQCGKRAVQGDRFCRVCGTQLRIS